MAIQKINPNSFSTKLLKNKRVLSTLEKISDHSTSFANGTSLVMSLAVRPISIFATPNTEKENKQYAAANSICSGLIKFAIVESVALPIETAIKHIDKNPQKFLKDSTINNLTKTGSELCKSKSYKLITQVLKLGTGFLTAIPKSMLTIALIPIIMDNLFLSKKQKTEPQTSSSTPTPKPNFTGNFISKNLSKIIDNKKVQNLAIKYENKDKDIAKHMTAATDILLTASSAYRINKSSGIKDSRKKALIYNNIISTAITLIGGYGIDKIIKKHTENFIEKFKIINAGDKNLAKYIEGINILRPAIIFAAIYYGILPIFSTFMGEKIDKYILKHSTQKEPQCISPVGSIYMSVNKHSTQKEPQCISK